MPLVTGRRGTRWTPPRASVSSPVKWGCHLLGFSGNQMEATYKPDGSPPGQSDREQGSDAEAPPMGGGGPRSSQKSKRSLQLSPADDYGVFTLSAGLRGWEYKKNELRPDVLPSQGVSGKEGQVGGGRESEPGCAAQLRAVIREARTRPRTHLPRSPFLRSSLSLSLSLHLIFLPHPLAISLPARHTGDQ